MFGCRRISAGKRMNRGGVVGVVIRCRVATFKTLELHFLNLVIITAKDAMCCTPTTATPTRLSLRLRQRLPMLVLVLLLLLVLLVLLVLLMLLMLLVQVVQLVLRLSWW